MTLVSETAPAASQSVPSSISTECPALRRASLLREGVHAHLHHRKHVPSPPIGTRSTRLIGSSKLACSHRGRRLAGRKARLRYGRRNLCFRYLARYGSLSRGATVPIPSQFQETIERKADYFETLLGILTVLARVKDPETPDLPFWLPRTSHHREGRVHPRRRARSRMNRHAVPHDGRQPWPFPGQHSHDACMPPSETQQDRSTTTWLRRGMPVWTRRRTGQWASRSPFRSTAMGDLRS